MELTIPLETVCRLITRARELEAQAPSLEDEDEDDPADSDDAYAALDEEADSAVEDEVRALLDDLAEEEVAELLALALVGRGTYDPSEWDDALEEAGSDAEEAIEQLLDMPMLAGYLEAGLAAFDLSCTGIGQID